jgi:signal transduction histidine kinase
VRDVIWSAQPSNDSLESLSLRVCQFAENLLALAHTQCRFDLPSPFPAISLLSPVRQQILYAAKEALNNVARHASATEVRISLVVEPSAFTLAIADNGCGFDVSNREPQITNPIASHGLENMRERIEIIGGQFNLDSHPGHGTLVQMHLSLSRGSDQE